MTETNTFYCAFVGNQYIICDCGEAFPSEDDLKDHLEKNPHENVLTTFTEYKCGDCFKVYATEQECIDHQETEHVPYLKEDHSYMKEEPQPTYTQEELCVKVEPDFGIEETYYIEEAVEDDEHDPTVLGLNQALLPVAYERLPPKPRGRQLTVQVTGGKPKKKKTNYRSKNVVCEVCGKKYASAAALRYHQRVHTGVRPYICTYCPKSFTMGLFLQIHIRTHTGERPYQCAQCPKAFSNKAALLRHDRVHTGVKPYACPKCGKTFTQSNSMKLHVHTVHLRMPAPYKSKRRKAESEARARARHKAVAAHGDQLDQADAAHGDQLDQIQIIQPKIEVDTTETYPELQGEVYYCDLPAKEEEVTYQLKEDEVTYELIYE